ncbi:MAG: VOC family protein [Rhodospirillales bacterium]
MSNIFDAPQLPATGQVFLDHVGCFVRDIDRVAAAMAGLDITMTPFTEQQNNGKPAGTANRCAMFQRGYIEVLTAVSDTPLAAQMNTAIDRYEGLHLICFTTPDAGATNDALGCQGFSLQPPVELRRQTADGEAAFTVLRLQPPGMPEGRIQFCTHYTPDAVWPDRYLAEGNRARALTGVLVAGPDPEEAAGRFARFTGRKATKSPAGWSLTLDRGALAFVDVATAEKLTGLTAPDPVWIAAIAVADRTVEAEQQTGLGPVCLIRHPAETPPSWL